MSPAMWRALDSDGSQGANRSHNRTSPSRRSVLWALALAPALVGMHRMLHLPVAASTVAPQVVAKGLSAFFLGHDAAECQLLDQLIHGGTPWQFYVHANNLTNRLAYAHTSFIKNAAPLMGRNIAVGL